MSRSTSVYQIDVPGQRVDEATALCASPRARAETYLQQRGATVLTLSGPARSHIVTCVNTLY